ncbi:MAG: hypothetical protein ABR551_05880 [Gemmatimonadales bacterium]
MSRPRSFLRGIRADSAEKVFFIRTLFYLWPTAIVAGVFLAYFLLDQERISLTGFWIMAALSVPGGLVFALCAWWVLGSASRGFVQVVLGAGNLRPDPSFSLEESLIVRGELLNARTTLEDRLATGEDTVAVQLRLADLNARLIRDPVAAERWYVAVRSGPADDRHRWAATNGLIDLYRASGQRGRLMVELARFAEHWPNTRGAADARRELRELKQDVP